MYTSPLDTGACDLDDDYIELTPEEVSAMLEEAMSDEPDWAHTTPGFEHADAN